MNAKDTKGAKRPMLPPRPGPAGPVSHQRPPASQRPALKEAGPKLTGVTRMPAGRAGRDRGCGPFVFSWSRFRRCSTTEEVM